MLQGLFTTLLAFVEHPNILGCESIPSFTQYVLGRQVLESDHLGSSPRFPTYKREAVGQLIGHLEPQSLHQ